MPYICVFVTLLETFVLQPTTTNEVMKVIRQISNKSSTAEDQLSNNVIKLCAPVISPYLSRIYNECITKETFPKAWKVSRIFPIFKSGERSLPQSYRPISLLSAMSKILEKILHSRMIKFVEKHKLLSSNQFGFRPQTELCECNIWTYWSDKNFRWQKRVKLFVPSWSAESIRHCWSYNSVT